VSDFSKQIIASSAGSFTTILLLNPLNVLKIRLQNSHKLERPRTSVVSLTTSLLRNEGVKGLWSGTSVALTLSLPSTVLFMTAYEKCKILLRESFLSNSSVGSSDPNSDDLPDPWWIPASAGALARVFSVTAVSPLELARTIKSSGTGSTTTISIMRKVLKNEGFRGLYKGWSSTLWRDCPYSAIYWVNVEMFRPIFYELLSSVSSNDIISQQEESQKLHPARTSASIFLAGSTASLMSAICTHPFDVIKTQRQLTTSQSFIPEPGNLSTIAKIVRQEGLYGVFRGLSMRLLTVIPSGAILLTIYETIKAIDF
jgi:solute carrier family 25 protein 39/40